MELWTSLSANASRRDLRVIADRARKLEADGWAGGIYIDSQILAPETFSTLAWCASATQTLKLGTGTSNPATRHPSVLASAAAAIQDASRNRFTLSMGRGDSSLAYVGVPPVPLGYFEKSLEAVQGYLRGEPVPTEVAASFLGPLDRGFGKLSVASVPEASTMSWMPDDYVKPEVEAAASGPKIIAAAARHADRISFALGANVARLKWAIQTARDEAEKIGRDPSSLSFGAYIPCYPHHDQETAQNLARGTVASMSRFSAMHKRVEGSGPVDESDRANMDRIAKNYNMNKHGVRGSDHAQLLDPEFIDGFGLVGEPKRCVEKVLAIEELGIDRLILWTGEFTGPAGESYELAVEELLPLSTLNR